MRITTTRLRLFPTVCVKVKCRYYCCLVNRIDWILLMRVLLLTTNNDNSNFGINHVPNKLSVYVCVCVSCGCIRE